MCMVCNVVALQAATVTELKREILGAGREMVSERPIRSGNVTFKEREVNYPVPSGVLCHSHLESATLALRAFENYEFITSPRIMAMSWNEICIAVEEN